MNWKQLLIAAGGTATAAAILYYLLRDEPRSAYEATLGSKDEKKRPLNVRQITREQVLEILRDIIKSQDKMKSIMKDLTKELIKNKYNFEKTYERVKEVQPEDPLERYGVSMSDFDQLLDKYQHEPNIREAINRIMGAPGNFNMSAKVNKITKQTVVKVHDFMLTELKILVEHFQRLAHKDQYDMKTVTIVAQALVGAKVEEEFDLSSEDIESAVVVHHQTLAADADFARINVLMQGTMSQLMGSSPYER